MKILLVGNKRKYGKTGKRGYQDGWFEELFREELIRTPYLDVYPFGWGYCDEELDKKKSVFEKINELGGVDAILTSHAHPTIEGFDDFNTLKVHITRSFCDGHAGADRCYKHYCKMRYDVMFGSGSIIMDRLKREKIKGDHFLLPWGVDIGIHRKLGVEKKYDVGCFYTTASSDNSFAFRIEIQDMLRKMPISLWDKRRVFYKMVKKVNESKICINYMPRPIVNARVTEVLACGSFLLTSYCEDYTRFGYKDRKHLVFYDGLDDLADKINYYLENDSRREKICSDRFY